MFPSCPPALLRRPDHPLISKERCGASVRPHSLGCVLHGGEEALERRLVLARLVEEDPTFDRKDRANLSHAERYLRSAQKMARMHTRMQELCLSSQDAAWFYQCIDFVSPTDVHMAMVIPALKYQTSPEQRARWLPLAESFRILGAYVQTELGHGSNVRAIETTATYDPSAQEWVIHSPTLTSMKWWPGGLGKTATHCVLMARVIVGGKDEGVGPFFVQLRDMGTHQPLPGIIVGDIGPKLGFNSTDNGFLRFTEVRVPLDRMLMGVARVTPEGKYERVPGGDKLAYGAMLDVRATLVMKASFSLGRAVTIAVRYSAVRQQGFRQGSSMEEVQVLDYPTQQRVLMPLLAYAFVLHFTGESMRRVYHKYLETLDGSLLPDLHATSSGLKALVTQSVADGIEAARKMCGGHGYLLSSGLPEASFNYLALPTLEGTQQVLEPQTARHMLRSLEAGRSGKRLGLGVAYLADSSHFECPDLSVPGALLHMDLLVKLFQERSRKCAAALERSVSAAGGGAVGMAKCGVEAGRAARGHCQLHILQCAVGSVEEIEARQPAVLNAPELRALKELVITYALWVIDLDMGDFREEGLLSDRAADAVRLELGSLCARLRTEAVALTDAFHFSDKYLGSDLGRYDGHVYDALYETALQEPLNAEDVAESYQYVKKLVGVAPGLRL